MESEIGTMLDADRALLWQEYVLRGVINECNRVFWELKRIDFELYGYEEKILKAMGEMTLALH